MKAQKWRLMSKRGRKVCKRPRLSFPIKFEFPVSHIRTPMKNPSTWPRLAGACMDARDDLRMLIPRLDAAIAAGVVSTEFLHQLRALAVRHAESLKMALKAPAGARQGPRSADSWRSGGLWAVLEADARKPTARAPSG